MDSRLKTILLAFLALNVMDGLLTLILVKSGLAVEGNPVMRALIDHSGAAYLVLKVGLGVLIFALLLRAIRSPACLDSQLARKSVKGTAYLLTALYALLLVNHAAVLATGYDILYYAKEPAVMYSSIVVAGLVLAGRITNVAFVKKAAKGTAYLLVIFWLFGNVGVVSAISVGDNVTSVGAGYPYILNGQPQFLYAKKANDGTYEIHFVTLNDDGTVSSDALLIYNITSPVTSVTVASNGKIYFALGNTLWVRTVISTNPLDFEQLKDDVNYFQQIGTVSGGSIYGLTPLSDRIYFFASLGSTRQGSSDTHDHIYFVDLSNYNSIVAFADVPTGDYGCMVGLAANYEYVYVAVSYRSGYSDSVQYRIYSHNGTLIFSYSDSAPISNGWNGKGWILLTSDEAYVVVAGNSGKVNEKIPLINGKFDLTNKTSVLLYYQGQQQAREIYGYDLGVYLYNSQANLLAFNSVFNPDPSFNPFPTPTPAPPPDNNPGNNPGGTTAIVVKVDGSDTDGTEIVEGKHKITVEDVIYGNKLEGAEIYVDGNYVGKTEKPKLFWFIPNFFADPELEYTFTAGNHTVKAVYGNLTDTMLVKVIGSSSQLYITVYVDGESADGISVTPGEHTIKVRDGEGKAIDGAEIYINGEYVGKTAKPSWWFIPNFFAEPELKYNFQTTGNYTIKAYYKGAEDTILVNVTSSGDSSSAITVKFDGESQDGLTFFIGKHTITVEDSSGKAIDGAEIYINGDYVGKTSKSWWIFDTPKFEYEFTDGSYTIKAVYNNLEDTINVTIQGVDPNNPDAVILFAIRDSNRGSALIGNFTVDKGERVCFVVAKQKNVDSIWDWDKISGAQIYINGQPVGITKKTDFLGIEIPFLGHFGGIVGYVHVFNESGTYEIYATGDFGTTQKLYVTVTNTTAETSPSSPLADFLKGIANNMPITGNETIDTVIWAVILLVVGIVILVLLLTLLRALL